MLKGPFASMCHYQHRLRSRLIGILIAEDHLAIREGFKTTALRSILLLVALTVIMVSEARAHDSTRHIGQYAHTAWRVQDDHSRGATWVVGSRSDSFRVIACNNSGVWNHQGATVQFTIGPAWHQTTGARALCLLVVCSIAYGLYLIKTRQCAAELRLRLDERLEERSRLARDLHDTLLQTVQCSRLIAEHVHESAREPAVKDALRPILEWLERATLEGRAALDSLRCSIVEGDDLVIAFRQALVNCSAGTGMMVSVHATGKSRGMHPIVRDEIYRIGNEAIRNACCHSGGSRIDLELVYGNNLLLRIRDDGKGVESDTLRRGKAGHYGLTGMRERAAHIGAKLVLSASQPGTLVVLTVPGAAINDFPMTFWPRFMSLFRWPNASRQL